MMIERLIRALILDRTLYEEVAADRAALSQAIGVVMLAGIANGLPLTALPGPVAVVVGIAVSMLGWLVPSGLVYGIGRRIAPPPWPSFRTVATCLGFADMPAVLNLFSVFPGVGRVVAALVWFWLAAAMVVATRAAFGVSLGRGAVIAGLGLGAYLVIGVALAIWSS
jgi:hypothetical protein